jgi:hypothetical protein
MTPLSPSDYEAAMTVNVLKTMRVLAVAMAISPVIYVGVGISSSSTGSASAPDTIFLVLLASVALVLLLGSRWFADRYVLKRELGPLFDQGMKMPKSGKLITDRGEIIGILLRGRLMLQMVLYESIAILGLMVCFLAEGVVRRNPLWYISLVPCLLSTVLILAIFPTKENQRKVFERLLEGRS